MDGLLDFVTPDQRKAIQEQALTQSLLSLGPALLQASTGAPGQGKPRFGQILGQAVPVGVQAYQGGIDQALRQLLAGQQMQEMQRKRQAEIQRQQQLEAYISGLPAAEQARFRAFPTQAAEAMFREPTEQFIQMTPEQVSARGLPTNKTFQMSSKTGRISEVGGGGTTVNVGGEKDPFDIEVAKKQAANFVAIEEAGRNARSKARDINRLDNLLSKVETGGAAAFKQAAGNIGINTEGLNDIQAAQAIINKLVPAQRPPGSGTMSDADLALYKESLPRIINQPGANKEIIRSMREINDYLIEEGKIAAAVNARKISREEGIRRMFALGNPIQDFFDRTAMGGSTPTPENLQDAVNEELKKRGLR